MNRSRRLLTRALCLTAPVLLLFACTGSPAPGPTTAPTGLPAVQSTLPPTAVPSATPAALPTPRPAVPVAPVAGLPAGTQGFPWWNDSIFYEIFVRSFADSDGDGIGDFNGVTSRLDYLAELGVTGLWLMPIQNAASYHGYDIIDYYAVEPDYGTLDDFKRLLAEARQHGIRVIIDLVLNHTSDKHPWFVSAQDPASPYHDWYVWSAEDHAGDSVWHEARPGEYYYGYFWSGMPDLNYANPAVTTEMEKVVTFWLQDVGVDGFRLDAAQHLIEEGTERANTEATHRWYEAFRPFYKALNPQALTVGEVWSGTYLVAEYVQGDELDLAFNFDVAEAFVEAARTGRAEEAMRTLSYDLALVPPGEYAAFLTNHDQNRAMTLFRDDTGKAKGAAALLLTAPGVPFIYYGEEIGMLGKKPDEQIRTPMQWTADPNGGFTTGTPWQPVNADFATKNVAAQAADPDSLLSHYRALTALRNQHAALRIGAAYFPVPDNPGVYALLRAGADEAVLVVLNLEAEPVTGLTLSLAEGPLRGRYSPAPLLGGGIYPDLQANAAGGFDAYQPVAELPGYSQIILQLQPGSQAP